MDYRSRRMIPIQELLNRIRWDDAYAEGDFLIGYYDRISGEIIQVPLQQVEFTPGNHFFFRYTGPNGAMREIPLHRIREVYRNRELIWHRGP
jgi:uncharacterized protein (UPF0248 family)